MDHRVPSTPPCPSDNGETWGVFHDTDTEKGSVRAGHEYSYPACVPWPKDSAEAGLETHNLNLESQTPHFQGARTHA